MSGERTSAMAGMGVKCRPRGLTVAAGEESSVSAWSHGVLDMKGRLKGLEGAGRTKTALGWVIPDGGWLVKDLKLEGLLGPPPALPDPPEFEPHVRDPEPETEPESAEEVDMAEER